MPEVVEKGLDYELGCDYYLNNSETLYALRWYKNDEEFFRYMPKDTPTRRVFNVRGIKINVSPISILYPPSTFDHRYF